MSKLHLAFVWVGAVMVTYAAIQHVLARFVCWRYPPLSPADDTLDLLTADVRTLQVLLQKEYVTSASLVDAYISHIKKHDGYLHAMIELSPPILLTERARLLDDERANGYIRGPLHGIPIVIKDNIATHPELGLHTTAGSCALFNSRPKRNAKLIDLLLKAGVIILGKSNLSEFSNSRGSLLPSGWSAMGGQTTSAYVRGGLDGNDTKDGHSSTSGSSSGSAVAVSAGYAPVAIGTETDGSLICPAGRAALYTIKPTPGLVSQEGIIPISATFDSAGPMTKSVYDLAVLLDVMMARRARASFTHFLVTSWEDISVATLDPEVWRFPPTFVKQVPGVDEQISNGIRAAYKKIEPLVKRFADNIPLIHRSEVVLDGVDSERTLQRADLKNALNAYLEDLEDSDVRSLQDLIHYNVKHAEVELPPPHDNQVNFIASQEQNLTQKQYDEHFESMRRLAKVEGIDRMLKEYSVDVIMGPSDGFLQSMAACSGGYPIAQMPLGYVDYNGRPYGLSVVAQAGREDLLVKVLSAWESTFPKRRPPRLEELYQRPGPP